jgi:hypothetical protein
MDDVMVINLDRRRDRWETMTEQLSQLFPSGGVGADSPTRIIASDGKKVRMCVRGARDGEALPIS